MDKSFNNNEKQKYFNQICGDITELIDAEKYCSITLSVGHERPREVNITVKKELFDELNKKYKKLKHDKYPGFELWKAILDGDKQAWIEMKKYCILIL